MTAHVSGLPVEEILPALMGGGGAFLLMRLAALGARPRPGQSPPDAPAAGDLCASLPIGVSVQARAWGSDDQEDCHGCATDP